MRFIASLLFLVMASAAMAIGPAGPPPWSCSVAAACSATDTCVALYALPMRFKLTRIEGDRFDLEYDGSEQAALILPSLRDARQFAETYGSFEPPPFILIPNDKISDTHSFWLQPIFQRGTGQRFIADEKLLVGCNSIRN